MQNFGFILLIIVAACVWIGSGSLLIAGITIFILCLCWWALKAENRRGSGDD